MPRIRSVKPEFFDSPGTSSVSPWVRLFYIAMWCWADDWGVGDANPRRLLGFAFPEDDASEVQPRNFRGLATEVSRAYGVQWYEVDGRTFYAIPSWERHQRTEKRAKQRFPGPDQAERLLFDSTSEVPSLNLGSSVVGTGEQGNRGTGEQQQPPLPEPHQREPDAGVPQRADMNPDAILQSHGMPDADRRAFKTWLTKEQNVRSIGPWLTKVQEAGEVPDLIARWREATKPAKKIDPTKEWMYLR